MLRRLLFQHQRMGQLTIAVFGAFCGMFLLLGALQVYVDVKKVFERQQDLNGQQYLVINKQVSVLNTLFGGKKGFDAQEIASLKTIEGVTDAAALTTSRFKVNVSTNQGSKGLPGFYTELFFEAVPKNYMDVQTDDWHWQDGDSLVPIIVPRDYMRLYNFGFATTQGLPQLTEDVIGFVRFTIRVSGNKGAASFQGKLAGFSDRINSILAPQEFIDYANEQFAGIQPGSQLPNRVIIACEGRGIGQLASYFSDNGYETNAESLRSGRLQSVMNTLMTVLTAVGLLIILLALLNFVLYAQLLLSKSSYELQTLIRIGYTPSQLSKVYMLFYACLYIAILVLALLFIGIGKPMLSNYFASRSPDLQFESGISLKVIGAGLMCIILFTLINFITIWRGIHRLAKP